MRVRSSFIGDEINESNWTYSTKVAAHDVTRSCDTSHVADVRCETGVPCCTGRRPTAQAIQSYTHTDHPGDTDHPDRTIEAIFPRRNWQYRSIIYGWSTVVLLTFVWNHALREYHNVWSVSYRDSVMSLSIRAMSHCCKLTYQTLVHVHTTYIPPCIRLRSREVCCHFFTEDLSSLYFNDKKRRRSFFKLH